MADKTRTLILTLAITLSDLSDDVRAQEAEDIGEAPEDLPTVDDILQDDVAVVVSSFIATADQEDLFGGSEIYAEITGVEVRDASWWAGMVPPGAAMRVVS